MAEQFEVGDVSPAIPGSETHVDVQTRGRVLVVVGSLLIALGTFVPWVKARFAFRTVSLNGWDLAFLHGPHFRIAIIPMLCAAAGLAIGGSGWRWPDVVRHAVGPALLVEGFLVFTVVVFAVGDLHNQLAGTAGYESSSLAIGFWMVTVGGVLLAGGAVASDRSPFSTTLRRVELWALAAVVEFVLLNISTSGLIPPLFVISALGAMGWGIHRTLSGHDVRAP